MTLKSLAAGLSALALGLAAGGAGLTPAAAQAPAQPSAPDDALTNPAFKGPQVIAFMGLKPGDRVADIVAGRFERALSQAVGPTGKVYAFEPAEVIKVHPQVVSLMQGLSAMPAYSNVELLTGPVNAMNLPPRLDAVFIRQNYHDLYDPFMGPADVPGFNRAVYAALKPGGVYVILDHVAAAGSDLRDTNTLHRIDPARVKADALAAGFELVGESAILQNPDDDHTKRVFDPTLRGKTDQFLFKFRKPA